MDDEFDIVCIKKGIRATPEDLSLISRYKHCLYKYVKVTSNSQGSQVSKGWLKSIHPFSGDLILVNFDEDYTEITDVMIMMAGSVQMIDIIRDCDENIKHLLLGLHKTKIITEQELKRSKGDVIHLIQQKGLPIRESNDNSDELIVCETLLIRPPYEAEDCISDDLILKEKIQKILELLSDAKL